MLQYPSIGLFHKFLHFIDNFVYPRLHLSVIILYIINQFAQAPEYVSLNFYQSLRVKLLDVLFTDLINVVLVKMRQKLSEIDENKWSREVIDSLYVPTGRVSHRPSEQNTDHHYLNRLGAKQFNLWLSSINVYFYLFDTLLFVLGHFSLFE
jgi:hypothetical protein